MNDVEPCALLDADDRATLAVGQGEPSEPGESRSCLWDSTTMGDHSIRVYLYDSRGITDVSATGEIKQLPAIGRHQAVQYMRGAACLVSVALTETSRVDAIAAAGDNTRSCDIALQMARMIEPKLPS